MSFETVALAGAGMLFAGSVVLYFMARQLADDAKAARVAALAVMVEAYRVAGLTRDEAEP